MLLLVISVMMLIASTIAATAVSAMSAVLTITALTIPAIPVLGRIFLELLILFANIRQQVLAQFFGDLNLVRVRATTNN